MASHRQSEACSFMGLLGLPAGALYGGDLLPGAEARCMTSLTLPMLLHSTSCSLYLAPSSHVYQTCVCVLRPYLPAWPRCSASDCRRGRSSNLCGEGVLLLSMHYSGAPRAGRTGWPPDLTLWIDSLRAHWLPASPPDPALLRATLVLS